MISKVNLKLLPMKGHYFFYNAATAPVIPFLPILARQLGFSGTIVGVIYTILPICGMLAKPLMGAVADRFRIKKLLFIIFIILTAAALLPINYIPTIPAETKVHFACDDGASVFDTSPGNPIQDDCTLSKIIAERGENSTLNCNLQCDMNEKDWAVVEEYWMGRIISNKQNKFAFTAKVKIDKIVIMNKIMFFPIDAIEEEGHVSKPICPNETLSLFTFCSVQCNSASLNELLKIDHLHTMSDVAGLYQFWIFFVLAIFAWVGMAVIVSIGDAICFEMLGDQPHLYGNQRMWGSIGWGVFSIIAGLMVDNFSESETVKNYTSVFYLMLTMMVLDLIVSSRLKYTQQRMSSSIIRDIGKLLANIRIIVFMIWCIFMGMCTGLLWQFLFWHLEDIASRAGGCDMHMWIKTLEGLVMGIQCLGGELPFFFLSGLIIKRLGHVHCMTFVLLGVGIRFILYSVLVDPWWVLPIELMNGITFGLFYATMASYASIAAPPGTEATVQGLVGAVFEGVGVSLGSLIGGICYDKYGGAKTFQIFGIASLICCVVHFCAQYLVQRRANHDEGNINNIANVNNIVPDNIKNDNYKIKDVEMNDKINDTELVDNKE